MGFFCMSVAVYIVGGMNLDIRGRYVYTVLSKRPSETI